MLLFAGDSAVLSPTPLPATPDNVDQGIELVNRQQGGGGTELLSALKRALALPGGEDRARSIVIVTDGYVSIETETFDLIRASLGNANVFAFGIGSSVNRFLIEGMARVGQGEPFIVTNPMEAEERAAALRRYIESPVLTKARLALQGLPGLRRGTSRHPGRAGRAARHRVRQMAWRPQGQSHTRRSERLGQVRAGLRSWQRPLPMPGNGALRYLWARSRIARLDDYQRVGQDPERVKEITRLGLDYHLLTNYTSFIAVDHVVRNPTPG